MFFCFFLLFMFCCHTFADGPQRCGPLIVFSYEDFCQKPVNGNNRWNSDIDISGIIL